MTSRAAAFALTLLLLAAGAFAAPPACCPSSGPAGQMMVAMDCCSSMVECPTRLQAHATIVSGADSSPAAGIVSAGPARPLDSAYDPRRPAASHGFLDTSPEKPPLYRLHAQLLI